MQSKPAKSRRMKRIFRENGRALIVALDHGSFMNVLPENADPGRTIDEVREGGADAILTTMGIASTFAERIGRMSLIMRVDGAGSYLDKSMVFEQRYTIEDAIRIGADAVAAMGFPGVNQGQTLHNLARIAGQCIAWNMPLLAEMMPGGFDASMHTPENITLAGRIGAEVGADIIKTLYTGDVESFSYLTKGVFAPVVVLGGGKKETDSDLLTMVHDAVQGGAAGVAVGRNVWRHDDTRGIVRALARVIHENASVEEALTEL